MDARIANTAECSSLIYILQLTPLLTPETLSLHKTEKQNSTLSEISLVYQKTC